jgi:hypothetical protein
MLASLKLNVAAIATAALVITAAVTAPYTNMFGKHYNKNKDFSCCQGDQLVINHYYSVKILWADVQSGYTLEPTGKALPGGCNIKCVE